MPTIVFVNEGKAGTVPEGTTVLQAALDLGVKISHVCGGNGTCSTCRVEVVVDGLSPINPQEEAYTMGDGKPSGLPGEGRRQLRGAGVDDSEGGVVLIGCTGLYNSIPRRSRGIPNSNASNPASRSRPS